MMHLIFNQSTQGGGQIRLGQQDFLEFDDLKPGLPEHTYRNDVNNPRVETKRKVSIIHQRLVALWCYVVFRPFSFVA